MSIVNRIINREEIPFYTALLILSILAMWLLAYITPFGMGLVNDSTAYIGGARNLLAGQGFSRLTGDGSYEPITHFPPMFSFTLVAVGWLGPDPLHVTRWVNIFFWGANIILFGILVRKMTGSKRFGLLGSILFMMSEPFLQVHSFALSEPQYVFLSFIVLLLLAEHLRRPAWYLISVAGFLTSLAYLTRYVGGALFASVVLILIVLRSDWKTRLREVALYLGFGIPGILVWSVRNMRVSGNAANRPFAWHPVSQDKWLEGLNNLWCWLLPELEGVTERFLSLFAGFLLLVLLSIGVYVVYMLVNHWRGLQQAGKSNYITVIVGIYTLSYLFLLIIAMTLFDDRTIFEHRILFPFSIGLLMMGVKVLAWSWQRWKWQMRLPIVLLVLFLFASLAEDTVDTVHTLHFDGQGLASSKWQYSKTVQAATELPDDKFVFSNNINALYLLANKPAFLIPWPYYWENGEPDDTYKQGVERYRQMVLDEKAFVVIFDYHKAVDEGDVRVIDMTEGLPVIGEFSDGMVFGLLPDS